MQEHEQVTEQLLSLIEYVRSTPQPIMESLTTTVQSRTRIYSWSIVMENKKAHLL